MASIDEKAREYLYSTGLSGKRVLIIDPSPASRQALRTMLATLDITSLHLGSTTAEVIRQCKTHIFDIIISDFHLEDGRDGQQLLEELRQQDLIPRLTIYLIVTGERSYGNVISVAELAPDDYLIKPFTAEQLETRLGRVLYRKHIFERCIKALDRGAYLHALAACDDVIAKHKEFFFEAMRQRCEILRLAGRFDEAEATYRKVLEVKPVPWAKMGLAMALHGRGNFIEAESLVDEIVTATPEYMAAYDFSSKVKESMGKLEDAQKILQQATGRSPHNTGRHRAIGEIAVKNKDYASAADAYGRVVSRGRGSTLSKLDDYVNLTSALIDTGQPEKALKVATELKSDRRGQKEAEMVSLVMQSLAYQHSGDNAAAKQVLEHALRVKDSIPKESQIELSPTVIMGVAQACLEVGDKEAGEAILRQVAAENNEDLAIVAKIRDVYEKTGHSDSAQALLDDVNREIVDINNRGVIIARQGDLEGAVKMLTEAADRVPNVQFLANATKAIFALIDKSGWDEVLADRGFSYLSMANIKDSASPRVASARDFVAAICSKHKHAMPTLRDQKLEQLEARKKASG